MADAPWICTSGMPGAGVVQRATRGAQWCIFYPSDFYCETDEYRCALTSPRLHPHVHPLIWRLNYPSGQIAYERMYQSRDHL